jgi:hypothetical protein
MGTLTWDCRMRVGAERANGFPRALDCGQTTAREYPLDYVVPRPLSICDFVPPIAGSARHTAILTRIERNSTMRDLGRGRESYCDLLRAIQGFVDKYPLTSLMYPNDCGV